MCVIIYKPVKKKIPWDNLPLCWKEFGDGLGYAIKYPDKHIITRRSVSDYNYIIKMLKKDIGKLSEEDLEVLIHFRKVSSGDKCIENTQPIKSGNMAIAHNGTMWPTKLGMDKSCKISDTRFFVDNFLKHVKIKTDLIKKTIEEFISPSRMVVMTEDSETVILNKNKDTSFICSETGVWYSNRRWEPIKVYSARTIIYDSEDDEMLPFVENKEISPSNERSRHIFSVKNGEDVSVAIYTGLRYWTTKGLRHYLDSNDKIFIQNVNQKANEVFSVGTNKSKKKIKKLDNAYKKYFRKKMPNSNSPEITVDIIMSAIDTDKCESCGKINYRRIGDPNCIICDLCITENAYFDYKVSSTSSKEMVNDASNEW